MDYINTLYCQNAKYLTGKQLGRMVNTALKVSLRNPICFHIKVHI